MSAWPFEGLLPLSYDLIVIDPPWPFDLYSNKGNHKSAAAHYDIMSIAAIEAMPVGELAQRDCLLLMWVTAPRLPESLHVMDAWGFRYKTNLTWRKTTINGRVRMGTGYWARSMHETVLLGTMGRPRKASGFPSLFDGVAREHSRKPDEFYDLVRKHGIGLRCADLFSRESRDGFDCWGHETGKFDEAAA